MEVFSENVFFMITIKYFARVIVLRAFGSYRFDMSLFFVKVE